MIKKFLKSIIGVNIFAFSLSIMLNMNLGLTPFDITASAIEQIFKIQNYMQAYVFLQSIFLTIIVILFILKIIQIKISRIFISIVSIFYMYFTVEFYQKLNITINSPKTTIFFLLVFSLFCFGLYLVIKTNIFIMPYDKFIVELSKVMPISPGIVRLLFDILLFIMCLVLTTTLNIYAQLNNNLIFMTIFTGVILTILYKIKINSEKTPT